MIINQYGVNVVTLALIYNYVANNNYSINMSVLNDYLEHIKDKMIKKYERYDIDLNIRNSSMFYNSYFITGDMRNNKTVMLNLGNDLHQMYSYYSSYIPSELITETLTEEALKIIGVEKDKLEIHSTSECFNKTVEVRDVSLRQAEKTAIKKNSCLGTEDVNVNSSHSIVKDDTTVCLVDITYTRTRERLDERIFKDMQKTKKKKFTSYYGF